MGGHGNNDGNNLPDVVTEGQEAETSIDIKTLENAAKKYDFNGRDLILHIDYEFQEETAMNFVVVDPVLFHTAAFVKVLDVATATADSDYETVDGFEEQIFDKVLTPEANKIVNSEIVEKTLAPGQHSYQGLGVFTFPLRIGNKIRVTLKMDAPVPLTYERLHVLTQETTQDTVVQQSKKKGLF